MSLEGRQLAIGYGSAVSLILTVLVTVAGLIVVRRLYRDSED